MNIISFRDFFILNPDYDIYSKMQYLFELHSGYNINTQPNDNFIKITRYSNLHNAFIKDDNSSDECSSSNLSDIYNEKNNKTNCIDNK